MQNHLPYLLSFDRVTSDRYVSGYEIVNIDHFRTYGNSSNNREVTLNNLWNNARDIILKHQHLGYINDSDARTIANKYQSLVDLLAKPMFAAFLEACVDTYGMPPAGVVYADTNDSGRRLKTTDDVLPAMFREFGLRVFFYRTINNRRVICEAELCDNRLEIIQKHLIGSNASLLHITDTRVHCIEEVTPFTKTRLFQMFLVERTEAEPSASLIRLTQGLSKFLRECVSFFAETYYVNQMAAFGPPKLDIVSDNLYPTYPALDPCVFTVTINIHTYRVSIKLNHPKMNELYDCLLIGLKSKYLLSSTLQGHPVVFAEQVTESGYREIVLQYVNA